MARPALTRCLLRTARNTRSVHTSVASLLDAPHSTSEVTINGFIRSIRKQKQRAFAFIGDGSSLQPIQAIFTPEQARSLTSGAAVSVTGSYQRSEARTEAQTHDLHVTHVDVIGVSDPSTFPIQKQHQTPEYLRTMPHLRTRIPANATLLRFRSDAIAAITAQLSGMGMTQTHTPIITSSDCEGAGEVFTLERAAKEVGKRQPFFKTPKYLTVSSQLHLEALSRSIGDVWTLSPTFRAERSDTPRHLSEFHMLEAEMTFVEDMDKVMDLAETVVQTIAKPLFGSRVGSELLRGGVPEDELRRRWLGATSDFRRITYTEAIDILRKATQQFEHEPKWGSGLQAEHERYIAREVGSTESRHHPVFVTHYPKAIKPFYMLPSAGCEDGRETVECFDLLLPEMCEVVGGSMREHRLRPMLDSMRQHGLISAEAAASGSKIGDLQWYLDLRKWGSVPHGGFGLGFDRLLAYLAGVTNIRDMVTFPRWAGRCDC